MLSMRAAMLPTGGRLERNYWCYKLVHTLTAALLADRSLCVIRRQRHGADVGAMAAAL